MKPLTPEQLLEHLFPPMLATLVTRLPGSEENWVFELKYDGFRAVSAVVSGKVAMWTRNAIDLKSRFPKVAEALEEIDVKSVVLDGEIVALDEEGAPRFQLLQQGDDTILFAFDLIWLNGHDLRAQPLEQRRELLRKLLKKPPKFIRISEEIDEHARKALELAAARGYEGLIAKQHGSPYENRRTKTWLKIKAHNAQEFAVAGYTPSSHSEREIGALLLGVMDGGELTFAGKVGTGYSVKQRVEFQRILAADRISAPAVRGAPRMKGAVWVRPRLVAQVRFTEWTVDGRLRHPAFLGLRPDKKPEECVRERPMTSDAKKSRSKTTGKLSSKKSSSAKGAKAKKKAKAPAPEVVLTSPGRILYPRDNITKQDVAEYFLAVSEPMIHALEDRPLALEHWNDGIDKPSWYQQNIGREAPPWMTLVETPTRTSNRKVKHMVADRPESLLWLAQHSVLTAHMWSSRGANLESPDWMIFDLDPAKGKGIEQAIDAALVLRKLFEQLGLPSVPKTSGKRGIHVLVPLLPGHTHDDAVNFACRIAEVVSSKVPYATVERSLAQRKGRLYFDCLQNGYGKTIVAPYSLRAIDGAPVSAPLLWSEVTKKMDPKKFNLRTMPERIAKMGDLFRPAIEGGVRLPRLRD